MSAEALIIPRTDDGATGVPARILPRRGAQGSTRRPAIASLAAALAFALGFIALSPNAAAQTLGEEQCALRIPLDQFKDEVKPGIQDAMLGVESRPVAGGAFNIEWITLIDTYIYKVGNRIRLDATFYVSVNYVIPVGFLEYRPI